MFQRPPIETIHDLFDEALAARILLEQVWSPETQFQGITPRPDDTPSRGQCGVSSLWFAQHLRRRGLEADFVEGVTYLDDQGAPYVWIETQLLGVTVVVDLTSDQYKTARGTRVHVGQYDSGPGLIGHYTPRERFSPAEVPRKKLLARYAILESHINDLSWWRKRRIR